MYQTFPYVYFVRERTLNSLVEISVLPVKMFHFKAQNMPMTLSYSNAMTILLTDPGFCWDTSISLVWRFTLVNSTHALPPKLILFCLKPLYWDLDSYDDTDLSDVIIDDHRHIPIVDLFPCLGSIISSETSDTEDVTTRIKKASNAFGALRKCIFASTNVQLDLKSLIYISVTLPILLYGCECWCLTESLNRKLRNFHNQCVRAMCRISIK